MNQNNFKDITPKRVLTNFGHFMILSELGIVYFRKTQTSTTDSKIKQKFLDDSIWILKNLDLLNTDHVPNDPTKTQVKRKYYRNLSELIELQNLILKQQHRTLQKGIMSELVESYLYTNLDDSVALLKTLFRLSSSNKFTLDQRISLCFSNILNLFAFLNPTKQKHQVENKVFDIIDPVFNQEEGNPLLSFKELTREGIAWTLNKACYFENILFKLLECNFTEKPESEIITLKIAHIMKCIDLIVSADIDLFENQKQIKTGIEQGLPADQYLQFSVYLKIKAFELLETLLSKFSGYLLRYLGQITTIINYALVELKGYYSEIKQQVRERKLFLKSLDTTAKVIEIFGSKISDFLSYIVFKSGKILEMTEFLYIDTFMRKEIEPIKSQSSANKTKKQVSKHDSLKQNLRLGLDKSDKFPFLNEFNKKNKRNLFWGLLKFIANSFKQCRLQLSVSETDSLINFVDILMRLDVKNQKIDTGEKILISKTIQKIIEQVKIKNSEIIRRYIDFLDRLSDDQNHILVSKLQRIKAKVQGRFLLENDLILEREDIRSLYTQYEYKLNKISTTMEEEEEEVREEETVQVTHKETFPPEKPTFPVIEQSTTKILEKKNLEKDSVAIIVEKYAPLPVAKPVEKIVIEAKPESKLSPPFETTKLIDDEIDISHLPMLNIDDESDQDK